MSDTVTVTTKVEYKAFLTPKFAHLALPPRPKQDGIQELPSIPVEELAPEVLDALAAQWLDHLYAKCQRASPFAMAKAPPQPSSPISKV